MRPEELLKQKREEILRLCARYGARNPRIFGSVARGEADTQSDLDFLVELEGAAFLIWAGCNTTSNSCWAGRWMW